MKSHIRNHSFNARAHACILRCLFTLCTFQFSFLTSLAQSVTDYVDPRIGSDGLGRVFIGPCMPFGMIKPSPDCGTGNNPGWGPMPQAVSGFSQTHVSGTGGGPKYGNILIRPFSGPDQHRATEDIRLGYYACTFQESGIRAEVTSAQRAALYRFTYPHGSQPYYEIDLTHFLGRNPVPKAREAQQFEAADMHLIDAHRRSGYQTISGGWNNGAPYTVYFYAEDSIQTDTMLLKVGISFISEEQARLNCQTDIPHWDFARVNQSCLQTWQQLLCRLPLPDEADPRVQRMYYTALYHMCLMPTDRTEVDHGGRPHDPPYYDDYYAIWDTYRTSTPLLTLLDPQRATAIAQSLLTIYQQDGFLPDARSGNSNGRTQGGSNAEIVLCDALANGLDIDADLALEAVLHDATVVPQDDEAEGRGGLAEYNRYGYIPYINNRGERIPRAGNRTVEYAFCDWAIARMAALMRERHLSRRWSDEQLSAIEEQYLQQSRRWQNLWRSDYEHDGARGFILPRDEQGRWLDDLPFGHSQAHQLTFRYTPDVSYEGPWYCKWWDCFMYEASSWEYSFSIPHDIPGLIEKCGGTAAFEARLDTFFAHGYYNVANEPSFLTPLLYHWVDKPEKSTDLLRQIIQKYFNDQPNGIPGNDDGGSMSSWLACHLLGQYPLAGTGQWVRYEPLWQGLQVRDSVNVPDALPRDPYDYLLKCSLHGQTRRFYLSYWPTVADETIRWTIQRNLRWWRGSFRMTKKALDCGTKLCYRQPLDGQHLTLADDELFCMVSRKVLRQIRRKGRCTFDGNRWQLVGQERPYARVHLYHLRSEEGAEMWVNDDLLAPYIVRMTNNPQEIDWELSDAVLIPQK